MGGDGRLTTLGAAADLLTGFPFKSAGFTNEPTDMRLVRGDNVVQGALRWEGVKRWSNTKLDSYLAYVLRPGDVVLAMDRPWIEAGLKHATLTEADCPSLLVQRVARLRARSGVNQRFLGYVVRSANFTNYILGVQTGTAVPHISSSQIRAYEFLLPSLEYQTRAAELLGALDDKIELNRRMSGTLESVVHTLFQSWFVDFDPVHAKAEGRSTGLAEEIDTLFPHKFDNGLPEGWGTLPFSDLFSVIGGNTPRTENTSFWGGPHQWASPKDLSSLAVPVLLQTSRTLTDTGLVQSSSGLLPPRTLLFSTRAPIGYMAFVVQPTAINQGFAGIVSRHVSTAYAWAWCHAKVDMIISNAGGSTFPEISKAVLRQLPMLAPPKPVLDAFASIADPSIERLVATADEMRTLAVLRDTLLPRLLSGELRITDGERAVAAVA